MKKRLTMALAAGALVAAMVPVPVAATQVSCGDVVTTDIRLTQDLGPCPKDGLVAGASGIRIDLNGHRITGAVGSWAGVRIPSPYHHVEVRAGTITGFSQGVVLTQTSDNHVWGLRLVRNVRGIDLGGSNTDNLIEKNELVDNDADAIRIDASDRNTIQKNSVEGSPYGISISNGADRNVITKNDVTDSRLGPGLGISVFGDSDGNVVEDNRVSGMARVGIYVLSGSDDTLVSKNVTKGNGWDGILVEAGPVGTAISKNTASGNGDDGIDVDSASTTLIKNTANGNADLGIEAVAGTGDGGGNRASGNGDPAECTTIACG
jgi:parallel beta-helix repeat protein